MRTTSLVLMIAVSAIFVSCQNPTAQASGGVPRVVLDDSYSRSGNTDYFWVDIVGDSLVDKVVWNPNTSSGRVRVYEGLGDSTFADQPILLANSLASESPSTKYYFADIDADGDLDCVRWDRAQYNGAIIVFYRTSNGTLPVFGEGETIESSTSENRTIGFANLDASVDGDLDFFTWSATADSGGLFCRINNSNGNWGNRHLIQSSENAKRLYRFRDMNNDQKVDVVMSPRSPSSSDIFVFLGDGTGQFSTSSNARIDADLTSTDDKYWVLDSTNDGYADIAVWNHAKNGGEVKFYINRWTLGTTNGDRLARDYGYDALGSGMETNVFYWADLNNDSLPDQISWRRDINDESRTLRYALFDSGEKKYR